MSDYETSIQKEFDIDIFNVNEAPIVRTFQLFGEKFYETEHDTVFIEPGAQSILNIPWTDAELPIFPSLAGRVTNSPDFVSGAALAPEGFSVVIAPGLNDIGIYQYTVEVEDTQGLLGRKTQNIIVGDVEKEFVVTVATSQDANGNRFYLDGIEAPNLKLEKGKVYSFNVSDTSNAGHPLAFNIPSDDPGTFVTRNNDLGKVYISISNDASASVEYFCTLHSGMGNTLSPVDASFQTVDINGVTYEVGPDVNLSNKNLSGGKLAGFDLSGADLSGADLSNMDLSGINLADANLTGTNFSGSLLDHAIIATDQLSNANFSGINAESIRIFVESDENPVPGLNFNGANLHGAYLSGDLSNSVFANADLSGSTIM